MSNFDDTSDWKASTLPLNPMKLKVAPRLCKGSKTSSSFKSADGPSNKKSEVNNFKLFINSQKIKKPQQSITSNLQIEKRTSNNIYNSTLKTQDYNNKLSARTTHKEEEEKLEEQH